MAESLSIKYRSRLEIVKEETREVKAATYLTSLNQEEVQRRIFKNIRVMEGKLKGGCTSKVKVTKKDEKITEYTKRESMEAVITSTNERKWHQYEGWIQLLEPQFTSCVGNYGEDPDINKVIDNAFQYPDSTLTSTKEFLTACKSSSNICRLNVKNDIKLRYNDTIKS